MAACATAAAAGVVGAGGTLFSYNRDNFYFDAPLRFSRFLAARGFAISQMKQYREDVHNLIGSTIVKMESSQTILTLFMCICAALSCAGRIGMHGPAPPQWFCALYSGHIFTALLYHGLGLWLSMHASLRAQCAMVSLLTRKVRLPIPSMSQLDQARVFGSSFEQQSVRDIFRVPFMRHAAAVPEAPDASSDEEEQEVTKKGLDPNTEFASTGRDTVPTWIVDEQVVDKGRGHDPTTAGQRRSPHAAPAHFQLILKAQEEWWQYDVYARIMLLFGTCNYLHAIAYYSIGTTIAELRGFWIMWSMPMLFMAAQALIFRLDILRGTGGMHKMPYAEWAGHVAPYIVISAFTIEYRFTYTTAGFFTSWCLVFSAYLAHIVMALRMLDCATPDWERASDLPEEPGKSWWPHQWKVPSAFSAALWIIAPPKKLEPGQHDLMHEMDVLAMARGGCRRRQGDSTGRGSSPVPGAISPQALALMTARLEKHFQFWFDEGVWPQVPDAGQRRLHELFGKFQALRHEVDYMEKNYTLEGDWVASSRPAAPLSMQEVERRIAELHDEHAALQDGLLSVEVTYRSIMVADFPTAASTEDNSSVYTSSQGQGRANLPWKLVRFAIISVVFMWVYMVVVIIIEIAVGIQSIMKFPGEPPWIRDFKMRSWDPNSQIHYSDAAVPSNYNLFSIGTANYVGSAYGYVNPALGSIQVGSAAMNFSASTSWPSYPLGPSRRTSEVEKNLNSDEIAMESLLFSLPHLAWLVDEIANEAAALPLLAEAAPIFLSPASARSFPVSWPPLFEPQHMSCSDAEDSLVALTSRGLGAFARLSSKSSSLTAEPFSLHGLHGGFGPIVGSSWRSEGLEIVGSSGLFIRCNGNGPEEGIWRCHEREGSKFPLADEDSLLAAAFGENGLVALQLESDPDEVVLFQEIASEGWIPAGEVHLPPGSYSDGPLGLNLQGSELLITTLNGEVLRRHLTQGVSSWHAAPSGANLQREYVAACQLSSGGLVRLALKRGVTDAGEIWVPEILIGA